MVKEMIADKFLFSHNWNNKLNCDCFTTIRLSGRHIVNNRCEILLKGAKLGEAIILEKKEIKLAQITEGMARLDTGCNRAETIKLIQTIYNSDVSDWSNQKLYWYLLKYDR